MKKIIFLLVRLFSKKTGLTEQELRWKNFFKSIKS